MSRPRRLILRSALLLAGCSFDGTGFTAPAGQDASSGSSSTTSEGTTTENPTTTPTPTGTNSDSDSDSGGGCGNGVVEAGETCDDGANNSDEAACKSNCQANVCGDGAKGPGEGCDDGNLMNGDGCSVMCASESCGDSMAGPLEECDDGNQVDDDGCTNACTLPECGDGILQPTNAEQCDDGPDNGVGQPCASDCTVNACGDGNLGPGEGCDDGNTNDGDGCSAACVPEGCGDGLLQGNEACDDGNMDNTDACVNCQPASCGDGAVQANVEACDDANMDSSDGCVMCVAAACGDGVVQVGVEECDDGNGVDNDACTNTCHTSARRAFITSVGYTGNLGGIAGADAKCAAQAMAAALGGSWMAWIASDDVASAPATRFLTKWAGVYRLVDGTKIADNWADLIDGSLDAALNKTEFGSTMGIAQVWTNVAPNGTRKGTPNCYDWTSNLGGIVLGGRGQRMAVDGKWTDDGDATCDQPRTLYCFEQ